MRYAMSIRNIKHWDLEDVTWYLGMGSMFAGLILGLLSMIFLSVLVAQISMILFIVFTVCMAIDFMFL